MTHQAFADAVGVSRGAVQQWERGKTAPTRKNQPAVAAFMGITVSELMETTGAASITLPSPTLSASGGQNQALAHNQQGFDATKSIAISDNPEYPAIRRVRFKLSAGASGFGVDYLGEDHSPIVFGKYWYESRGLHPSKLFAVRVSNDSMHPGLNHGDTVVVNTASTTPQDSVAFAVNYEGELVVKRLVRDEGEWWLSSDNPDQRRYPRKRMTEDCFVIGEIIHKQSERI